MDEHNLPDDLADRPRSQEGGVPVPFVCADEGGSFDIRAVRKRRAIQCALSRICGLCGVSLGWPVAFLGSEEEADAGALHFPPLHEACAEAALRLYPPLGRGVLGVDAPAGSWVLLTTGGFELERPADRHGDQRVAFRPNSVAERRTSAS
jgi:hypothetical protein